MVFDAAVVVVVVLLLLLLLLPLMRSSVRHANLLNVVHALALN